MNKRKIVKVTGTELYINHVNAIDTFVLTADPMIAGSAEEILTESTKRSFSVYFPTGIEVVDQLDELMKYLAEETRMGIFEKNIEVEK